MASSAPASSAWAWFSRKALGQTLISPAAVIYNLFKEKGMRSSFNDHMAKPLFETLGGIPIVWKPIKRIFG